MGKNGGSMKNVLILLLISIFLVGCQSKPEVKEEPKEGGKMEELSQIFEEAVRSKGEIYLSHEQKLIKGVGMDKSLLSQKLSHNDPVGRLLASVLIAWIQDEKQEFIKALGYLDYIPRYIEKTPVLTPPPDGVAAYLSKHFQGRVTKLLTLRLLKEDWPRWRVFGVLLYLKEQKDRATTEGLIRFAVETPNDEWRKFAVETIQAIGDPALPVKVDAERKWLEQSGISIPKEVDRLNPAK